MAALMHLLLAGWPNATPAELQAAVARAAESRELVRSRFGHPVGVHFATRPWTFENIARRECGPVGCDPVLVGVGRAHTGTSSLAAVIRNHSLLDMGITKEHRFDWVRKSREDYRREFPSMSHFGVDITPRYYRQAKVMAPALPNAKILLHIRDPLDLQMSIMYTTDPHYFHRVARYDPDLCLAQPVQQFLNAFGKHRFMVIEAEKLKVNHRAIFMHVLEFIGVPVEPAHLPLEAAAVCKRGRYRKSKGRWMGCEKAESRVWNKTRLRVGRKYAGCRRELGAILGVDPLTLHWGGPF